MAQTVLRSVAFAKTTRPVIGNFVRREELLSLLEGTPARTVAWISGPAGSGKTTLAASYVETRRLQCVWYQVDPDDADVASFFHYLAHAARKLTEGKPPDLPIYSTQQAGDVAAFSRRFFRQLFALAKAPTALVLDNLHEILAESPLHSALEAGFAEVTRGCCIVVTSRAEPPKGLARMRASGKLAYVGWDQLAFSALELAAIARMRGRPLTDASAAKLHQMTQGWAAGLILMLEHAKLCGDFAEIPEAATPQVIFDYLAGEIFDRFEPRTQQFLLRISCLPRMTADVAETVSGEAKAALILINLAHNDYFVREILSAEGCIYQIHPLLRDFLRQRASRELPETLSRERLRLAASLLRGAGQTEDAVALLADNHDWSEVAAIAVTEAGSMVSEGRGEILAGWLELLPPRVLDADPRLLLALASCRTDGEPRAARRLFERAYAGFLDTGSANGMIFSCCGVIDAIVREFDDLTLLDGWVKALENQLATTSGGRTDAGIVASLTRARLLRSVGQSESPMHGVATRVDSAAERQTLAELPIASAVAALLRGDVPAALSIIGRARTHGNDLAAPARIAVDTAAALHELIAGNFSDCCVGVEATLAMATAEGIHGWDEWLKLIRIAAAVFAGDRVAAAAGLREIESGIVPLRRGDRAFVHYLKSWLAVLDDEPMTAQREVRTALATASEVGIPWLECLVRLAAVHIHAAAGEARTAQGHLRGALEIVEHVNSPLLRFLAEVAAAVAAFAAKDDDLALSHFRLGAAIGHELAITPPLVRTGLTAELCALALRRNVEADFSRALIRAARFKPPASVIGDRCWPFRYQIETFGQFRVLREGVLLESSKKGRGRPDELIKVLISLGRQSARGVRAELLADALWPHVDADYAQNSFNSTLHRLRRDAFAEDEALILRDGYLSLNPELFAVDIWAMDRLLDRLDELLRRSNRDAADFEVTDLVATALSLYRGPYLADDCDQPSYIACREQIRQKLRERLTRAARHWEQAGRADTAADCYRRCIEVDELWETPYCDLMRCHHRQGNRFEAMATYERLGIVLASRLRTTPSAEAEALHASLKEGAN